MDSRWIKGVWLGKRFGIEEHIVSMPDGSVVRSPAVKIHPDGEFDREMFDSVKGVPWDPSGVRGESDGGEAVEVPGDIPKNVVNEETKAPPVSRAVIINRKYLEQFGFLPRC